MPLPSRCRTLGSRFWVPTSGTLRRAKVRANRSSFCGGRHVVATRRSRWRPRGFPRSTLEFRGAMGCIGSRAWRPGMASPGPPRPAGTCMATYNSPTNAPEEPPKGLLRRHVLFRTDHKTIGLRYLWLALLSVFVGMILSLVMRIQLVWPGVAMPLFSGFGSTPERYAALTLLHGSLMVLMVLTAAPQAGFGNYLLPIQIGARDMPLTPTPDPLPDCADRPQPNPHRPPALHRILVSP